MKKMIKLLSLMLAATLLFAACGGTAPEPSGDKNKDEDTGPSINYEDYIDPVVDRKVADLITAEELSDLMDVEVALTQSTDSEVYYQSENGYYIVRLLLENQTREEFDALVADTAVWTPLEGVGEAAYWTADQTELVAYQNGYAVSVWGDHVYYGCLQMIMERLLDRLE